MKRPRVSENDAQQALRDHVFERALLARERHEACLDAGDLGPVLADREVVRYPTSVDFDASLLEPGEPAYVQALGESPTQGFRVHVHPRFRSREGVVARIVAYQLVRVNYGEVATHEEAELFGATLFGLEIDDYYAELCSLADELGGDEREVP